MRSNLNLTQPAKIGHNKVYYRAEAGNDCPKACSECDHDVFQLTALAWVCEYCSEKNKARKD